MITQKLGLAMLAIAASIVWTGCDSKVQPGAKARRSRSQNRRKLRRLSCDAISNRRPSGVSFSL